MQYIDYDNELNERQLEAVRTSFQYVRVVAGAGSGKTRVLTYRIAYLIDQQHVEPWKILAITFTNKVANEMKNRVLRMIPEAGKDLKIKTFHSFAAFFLRSEISVLDFPTNFNILDEEDQTKLIKDIISDHGYKRNDPIFSRVFNYISLCKSKEKYPEDVKLGDHRIEGEKELLEIYQEYEDRKNIQYSLDFDDLLLYTNIILENHLEIRLKWQRKFDHILIDEFQDTNDIEYRMVKFLLKPYSSLYVVGDPDQTIYTWRGANQNIILNLEKTFNDIETIVLDRNYRSTQNILDSANKLIAHNKKRIPKNLYTNNNQGEKIIVKHCTSSKAEAHYVAREIALLKNVYHFSYSDIVLLYRSNYVSHDFEDALTANRIPYVIYGGLKFYERREIKDVLCYFRLINNIKDDIAFERIMNVPSRKIGESSANTLKAEAKIAHKSLYEYILSDPIETTEAKKAVISLKNLIAILEHTKDEINKDEEVISKILEDMIISFGYYEYLLKEDNGEERIENVKQLFADLRSFLQTNPGATFDEYLQNIALLSSQDELDDGDHITLMTVHTAKGLEFPVVFVVRFNDAVFPHIRAVQESGFEGMEEERRLAYVALTRAKERLYLTYADGYSYVISGNMYASQFIKESGNSVQINREFDANPQQKFQKRESFFDDGPAIDIDFAEPIRQNFTQQTNSVGEWNVGDIVIHTKLGKGIVIALEGDGIIQVEFEEHGVKSLLGNHKALSKGVK